MFSKKLIIIVAVIVLIIVNIIILFISAGRYPSHRFGRIALYMVAPVQEAVTNSTQFAGGIWHHYFWLVSVSKKNDELKKSLSLGQIADNQCQEIEQSNIRLRNLLKFQNKMPDQLTSAEVIGKDPSPWFKAIIIDKGKADGMEKGMAVVVPKGIAGQITDVSSYHSKVMLLIDRNSSIDALVQRTRTRGIIKGSATEKCFFKYVLRKEDIKVGDNIVASGLDGVYPKGLRIGEVTSVIRRNAGIFQDVMVMPYVNYEKIEEVLVITNPPKYKFVSQQ